MTKITVEIDEKDLRRLVIDHLSAKLGTLGVNDGDVSIEVKSKQNYKSEWEEASFRARIDKTF